MEQIKKLYDTVYVSDRIITYKSAAAILNVDVKEIKSILIKFIDFLKSKQEKIGVSHLLGGITVDKKHKIVIVSQNKYEETKSQFKKLTIDQIYSIQKSILIDWIPVFNVDDLLYDPKDKQSEKQHNKEIKQIDIKKDDTKPQITHKKGSISSFVAQNNTNKKTAPKKEVENEKKTNKVDKPNLLANFINKSNKENFVKNVKPQNKIESDDEEEIVKGSKKRTRMINDEDEDENIPSKCAKVDILDEEELEEEEEKEYKSDSDIFGSPEKDEDLMKNSEEMDTNAKEENTQTATNDAEEENDIFYEDDDGYFVTEKKSFPKNKSKKPELQTEETKKEIAQKNKVEKTAKKEITQKIKNNTNQKSILSFFQKK